MRPILLFFVLSLCTGTILAQQTETLQAAGLLEPVEILMDPWGIPHIYAENQQDLFFAQGYNAARERLFQFELWRRQATGTVAEILGRRELDRDIGARLFRFRGDLDQELNYYHDEGKQIIEAYVKGINAYIGETEKNSDLLPLEFGLLGIKPGLWTPADVISRHQGLLGNIGDELDYGRAVARAGGDAVREVANFHPGEPALELDPTITIDMLEEDILHLYNAFRQRVVFRPDDIAAMHRGDEDSFLHLTRLMKDQEHKIRLDQESIGSNNWVVDGRLSSSGYPMMANDPHRRLAAPSLRFWVHLVAPGWNVIGGGEPTIPGVSIGHNEYGTWGLTVFPTDGEDLYVYDINPDNPNEYWYAGGWESMRVIKETIPVKEAQPVEVELKYTHHGPVVFEDDGRNKAYAVRAAWMEIGGSPYLASLRMDQAKTWEEFREACAYSHIPGENMVWAGRDGTIGWQSVGIAPVRPNWDGLLPVPGDGRYEWAGYLPIKAKPHVVNPEQGFWATANENLVPPGYIHREAVGWEWSDPFRSDRLHEVLRSGKRNSIMDMMLLQTDYLSIPARNLVPLLKRHPFEEEVLEGLRLNLLAWDYRLEPSSVEAGVYVAWEQVLRQRVSDLIIPATVKQDIATLSMKLVINHLVAPGPEFGENPVHGRDALLAEAFGQAIADLEKKLGSDRSSWTYGQTAYKHVIMRHPLSTAVDEDTRRRLDVGPYARGGNSYTVNNTSSGDNQASGATFRIIVDTGDWDTAVGMNAPGQSGNVDSPHYNDLFEEWAKDGFFPVYYSRERIERVSKKTFLLEPGQ